MTRIDRRVVLAALLAPLAARATDPAEPFLAALRAPGVHAIMRHAIAPGKGDPPGFRVGDAATQRRLSDAGRAQARAAGRLLREGGVLFDRVLSSQWDRCMETALLLDLGPVTEEPALNSFFADRSTRAAQTAQVAASLAGLPPGARVMLVTHQVNVTALTGVFPASGEILAIRPAEGRAEAVARLRT